jgi:hypothetical protein
MGRHTQRLVVGCLLAGLFSACAWIRKETPPTVLFDEAHGQRFLIGQQGRLDLSSLSALFQFEGLAVKTNPEEINDRTLASADALVISGPFAPLTPTEIDATLRFLDRGGRLCVMLHIPPPAAELLKRLDVVVSNGVIRERQNVIGTDPLNFRLTKLTPHELTKNLDGFDAFGVWALLNEGDNVAILAQTSPEAFVDLNGNQTLDVGDAVQSFGVAVTGTFGKGRFVVFGDDAIFQNQFLTGSNVVLATNLAKWLGTVR